jgi:ABC-type antimicrobial peptide transport system permease subunit
LFAFILAESFGLALAGALLGIGGAYALFTFGDIPKMTNNIFLTFEVTPRIIGLSACVAVTLGIVACIFPCRSVARASVVEGLKTLD